MMSVEKKSTKNEDKEKKRMKGEGCKFSTELSVHYRVIRDEAGPDKGPQCCQPATSVLHWGQLFNSRAMNNWAFSRDNGRPAFPSSG